MIVLLYEKYKRYINKINNNYEKKIKFYEDFFNGAAEIANRLILRPWKDLLVK